MLCHLDNFVLILWQKGFYKLLENNEPKKPYPTKRKIALTVFIVVCSKYIIKLWMLLKHSPTRVKKTFSLVLSHYTVRIKILRLRKIFLSCKSNEIQF